jgi:predicted AlkP superfamily pyrophosphatase or phosphodiesterase
MRPRPVRNRIRPVAVLPALAAIAALACVGRSDPSRAPGDRATATDAAPAVLLVSIDGFRADYIERGLTPNLLRIGAEGVRADGLEPSFPTKTFPNHYSIVTGLVPDHHGIVANNIWDPDLEADFCLSDREAVGDGRWWGGEPVWVAAERAGLPTAPLFWPGSEAEIAGVRPTHWLPYDGAMEASARIEWLLDRLDRPPPDGVAFATLYFDDVDAAGHRHGPDAAATDSAIAAVDAAIGLLLGRLADRGLSNHVNLIVVSDHGMSPTSRDRVILVDDYLDPAGTRISDWNPLLAIWPAAGDEDRVYEALRGAHPHLQAWRKHEVPARFCFGTNRRVAPVLALADPGWTITTRSRYEADPGSYDGGNHGYDNAAEDMLGLFVARGPGLRPGLRVPVLRNIDVYPLLMALLRLPPRETDADPRAAGLLSR